MRPDMITEPASLAEGLIRRPTHAPPPGRSVLHQASAAIRLEPFRFDRTGLTFQMDFALVSSSEAPRQRTYLALAGRRMTSICLPADPAPASSAPATLAELER